MWEDKSYSNSAAFGNQSPACRIEEKMYGARSSSGADDIPEMRTI